jgi:hypothetical protein
MRRRLVYRTMSILSVLAVSVSASAQERSVTGGVTPDFRVKWLPDSPAHPTSTSATPASAARRGLILFDVNLEGGVSRLGTGKLIDNICGETGLDETDEFFTSVDCGGSGGGTAFGLGAYVSFTRPLNPRLDLQIRGGWRFTAQHSIELDAEASASIPPETFDIEINGGYRFKSHSVYGGAGVEFNNIYVGGNFGIVLHSGEEFLSQLVRFNNQIADQLDETRDRSGSAPFVGVRLEYEFIPGFHAVFELNRWKMDDLYEELADEFPDGISMPVNARSVFFGVSVGFRQIRSFGGS